MERAAQARPMQCALSRRFPLSRGAHAFFRRLQASKPDTTRTRARAEKMRLRELKKQQEEQLERIRVAQNANIATEGVRRAGPCTARWHRQTIRDLLRSFQSARQKDKFAFLLAQTEIFAHFLTGAAGARAAEAGKRHVSGFVLFGPPFHPYVLQQAGDEDV